MAMTPTNKDNPMDITERTLEIDDDGTKRGRDVNVKLRSIDGPVIEWEDGTKQWWVHGQRHNEHGPAIEWANGDKEWWVNGQRHNEHGPAIERANGDKLWYQHGKLHNEHGPAVELADGTKEWYRNGEQIDPPTSEEVLDAETSAYEARARNNPGFTY